MSRYDDGEFGELEIHWFRVLRDKGEDFFYRHKKKEISDWETSLYNVALVIGSESFDDKKLGRTHRRVQDFITFLVENNFLLKSKHNGGLWVVDTDKIVKFFKNRRVSKDVDSLREFR